jgi:hypothetical protein
LSAGGDSADRTTPLTLFTAIRPRWTLWLRPLFRLATWLPLPRWTLLRLKLIHYARWAIVSHVPPGAPRGERRRLPRSYLFFESNFNGTPASYIEAFSYVFPKGMRALWGSSHGFPGPIPSEGLRAWIQRGALPASHHYCAYPEATTREVLAALEVSRGLDGFRRAAEDLPAEEFAAAYERLIDDQQLSL